jgi:hypothetical protein
MSETLSTDRLETLMHPLTVLLALWLLLPVVGFMLVGWSAVVSWFVGTFVGLIVPPCKCTRMV